jgi:hypothetical protein
LKDAAIEGKAEEGPRVRAQFAALAHWLPAVVTEASGEATVEMTLPDSTTTWRLTSRGATPGTLFGEQREEVVSKKDFFVEARFPASMTEGDVVKPIVRVHSFTGKKEKAEVSTKVTLAKTTVTRSAVVETPERGASESALEPLEAGRFEWGAKNQVTVETEARSGNLTDAERVTLPLRAWGSERRVGISGTATASVTRTMNLGEGAFPRKELEINLGPPPNRLLVDLALSRRGMWRGSASSVADWVLVTHAVLEYLRGHGRGGPETAKLEGQLASLALSLTLNQLPDGGIAWAGKGPSDAFVSARALRALALAKEQGVSVPDEAFQRLVQYVGGQFRARAESNHVEKAALLYGLAHVGDAAILSGAAVDVFASANRLFRLRGKLTITALAYLTLTLDRLGRKEECVRW